MVVLCAVISKVWNERAKNAYVQSIPFESRRCDREGSK